MLSENKMNALKKLEQAKYHLNLMKTLHPNEKEFLFNLASFISTAREVTWYLQKEFKGNPEFDKWYEQKQKEMSKNDLLKFFRDKRNVVVKESYPNIQKYTGIVKFYYTNAQGNIAMGECWAHPSMQPTDIIVPGGVVTIAPDHLTSKTSINTILRKVEGKNEYFFKDKLDKPILKLTEKYLSVLYELCIEWKKIITDN